MSRRPSSATSPTGSSLRAKESSRPTRAQVSPSSHLYINGRANFYRPQHSCGKVMFLHPSVILFTWGGVWQTPPGRHTPGQTHPPWEDTPLGRQPHPHCSGRYASYWNAFLLCIYIFYLVEKAQHDKRNLCGSDSAEISIVYLFCLSCL